MPLRNEPTFSDTLAMTVLPTVCLPWPSSTGLLEGVVFPFIDQSFSPFFFRAIKILGLLAGGNLAVGLVEGGCLFGSESDSGMGWAVEVTGAGMDFGEDDTVDT